MDSIQEDAEESTSPSVISTNTEVVFTATLELSDGVGRVRPEPNKMAASARELATV